MWSFKPCKCLAACSAKRVPSFLNHFKTLFGGLASGIKPMTTSRRAVHLSTDRANPATERKKSSSKYKSLLCDFLWVPI